MKYICLLVSIIYVIIKTKKYLQLLQQNWYDDDHRYLKWINENKKKVFLNLEIVFIILLLVFLNQSIISYVLGICFYGFLIILNKQNKKQSKLPLKVTKRVRRLILTICLLYLILVTLICINDNTINYLFLSLLIYMNPFVLMVANIINIPIEKMVGRYYKKKAINKLRDMKNLKVIGITGSYGKTSSKNILYDVLDIKYNVFKTPKNYNTPNGMMLSINNYLDKFNDYFIAEMGAFKKGEIKELCDMMHPTYGILTKIGTAHLESFGSRQNIQEGKFELIESLPEDGIGILNKDDEMQRSYELKNNCKIVWIGIDMDADVRATNIKLSPNGTEFDCIFKGDENKYHFNTKLLGKANIYNILASIALGKELGVDIEQLKEGVLKVMPVEHRLELKKMGNINIIDDAYNSNPVGSKMALEVLNLMPGKKIIVTPGMIEMGEEQDEINKNFGKQIADVCDEVILIGETQTKPIYEGLKEKGYNNEHIHILDDVRLAFPLIGKLKEGETYALLENDLPDIFDEK